MKSKEFGEYLKSLRETRKMTLVDVEREVKISNGYLSQVESGKRGIPHFDTLKKLSVAYKVPITELIQKAESASDGNPVEAEEDVKFVSRGFEKLSVDEREELKNYLGYLLKKRKP